MQKLFHKNEFDIAGMGDVPTRIRLGGIDKNTRKWVVPNINISKWNDEAFFNLNHSAIRINSEQSVFENGKLSITVGNVKTIIYALNPSVLEYEVHFAARPDSSYFDLDITASDSLSFFYQDVISDEQAQHWVDDGIVSNISYAKERIRPQNVVGSYAVYHNKKHNEYKTGKFCHLYRWEVTDAKGRKEWCHPLQIDRNTLRILLPEQFLRDAVYPIKAMGAGDSIGVESSGSSGDYYSSNAVAYGEFAASAGSLDKVFILSDGDGSSEYWIALLDESGSAPNQTVANSLKEITPANHTKQWTETALSPTVSVSAANYYIMVTNQPGALWYYDSGATLYERDPALGYSDGAWSHPESWSGTSTTDYNISAYYQYVVAAGVARALAGTVAAVASVLGTPPLRTRFLVGSFATIASLSAVQINRLKELVGSFAATSSVVVGVLKRLKELVGSFAVATTISAVPLNRLRDIIGSFAVVSSISGSPLNRLKELVGSFAATSALTGALTKAAAALKALAGTIAAVTSVSGAVPKRLRSIQGGFDLVSTFVAAPLKRLKNFVGSFAAVSAFAGALTKTAQAVKVLVGIIAATSSLISNPPMRARSLIGSFSVVSAVTAALTKTAQAIKVLAGTIAAVSSISAISPTRVRNFIGSFAVTSTFSGIIKRLRKIQGSFAAIGQLIATLVTRETFTPSIRTYAIKDEDRVYVIKDEDRTYTI